MNALDRFAIYAVNASEIYVPFDFSLSFSSLLIEQVVFLSSHQNLEHVYLWLKILQSELNPCVNELPPVVESPFVGLYKT